MTSVPRIRAEMPPEQPGSRPVLTLIQLEVLGRYGTEQDVDVGDVLFADGDATYDLVVVLGGAADVRGRGRRDARSARFRAPDPPLFTLARSRRFPRSTGLTLPAGRRSRRSPHRGRRRRSGAPQPHQPGAPRRAGPRRHAP